MSDAGPGEQLEMFADHDHDEAMRRFLDSCRVIDRMVDRIVDVVMTPPAPPDPSAT
jgi:hypothetical protein